MSKRGEPLEQRLAAGFRLRLFLLDRTLRAALRGLKPAATLARTREGMHLTPPLRINHRFFVIPSASEESHSGGGDEGAIAPVAVWFGWQAERLPYRNVPSKW